jgi:hypothetical protein
MSRELSYKHIITSVILGFLVAAMWVDAGWRVIFVFAPAVMLIVHHFYGQFSNNVRKIFTGLALVMILGFGVATVGRMFLNIQNPPVWDFVCFWLNGRVASQGLDLYSPAAYQSVALAERLNFGEEFKVEILDVGFWYPPPTIFIFVPLGWFDIHTAMLLWYIVQGIILIVCIGLLWKVVFNAEDFISLCLVIVMLIAAPAVRDNIGMGQSMFMVLLMFILFWRDREKPRAGVWLALGILVKPFMAVLILYPLLRRYWRMVGVLIVSLAILSLLTIATFGIETFFSYFSGSVLGRVPLGVYIELTNQSLLSTVLRLEGHDGLDSPLTHPPFVGLAIALTLFTLWGIYTFINRRPEWAILLILTFAVLIYPASQDMYSLMLIMPMLLLWRNRQNFPGGLWGIIIFIMLEYYLMISSAFLTVLLMWIVLMLAAARIVLPSVTETEVMTSKAVA